MDEEDYMTQGGFRPLTPIPPRVTPPPLPAAPATLPRVADREPQAAVRPSPYFKYLPDYAGKLTLARPRPGYGLMLPEVTVRARTRNRNADGSPMTSLDIRRAEAYAARTGYGLNGARDASGRVMPPEEQRVAYMARMRPDYEGLSSLVQFGLSFTPGWALDLPGVVGCADDIARFGYKGYCKLDEWLKKRQYHYTPEDYRDEMAKYMMNRNTLGFTF